MTDSLVSFVQTSLEAVANPDDAGAMAAYMKTEQPFYGVRKPLRKPILRQLKQEYAPSSQAEYEANILAMWGLPHREEKYIALDYALQHKAYMTLDALPMFEQLIREGAWWDFVDLVAINLVGVVLLKERAEVSPVMEAWIEDEDMWIRRSAILAQNKHKAATDEAQLFDFCLRCAHETEFFIRKAIGWALRDYSKTAPEAVEAFLAAHKEKLSGLSYREGMKLLKKKSSS